jgi:acyl carrier protein
MNATTETSGTEICAVIAPHLKFHESHHIPIDASLAELGLDSMASINLLLDLEDHFGISIPDELIDENSFATLNDVTRLVEISRQS